MAVREGKCPEHGAYVGFCSVCANKVEHQLKMSERRRKIEAAKKGGKK